MHLVSQSAQVRNPSSSKDEAALQKDEELLLTVESNSQLARALSPFLGPLASEKTKVFLLHCRFSYHTRTHTSI